MTDLFRDNSSLNVKKSIYSCAGFYGSLYISMTAHELGHALVAKCYGDSIKIFSVGSGPSFSWEKRNTTFKFGLYPTEGYVRRVERYPRRYRTRDLQWLFFPQAFKKNTRIDGFIAAAGPLAGAVVSAQMCCRGDLRQKNTLNKTGEFDGYAFGMFAGGMIGIAGNILNLHPGEKESDGYWIAEAFQTPAAKRQFYGRMVTAASVAFPLYIVYAFTRPNVSI